MTFRNLVSHGQLGQQQIAYRARRFKTLEWLAEFVMCTEDSIPVSRQQQLIPELLNVTEMDGADFHHLFASAERRNANLKSRVFNELAAKDSRNGAFENHKFAERVGKRAGGDFPAMAWKKGQSGNPKGGSRGRRAKSFDDELREAVQRPRHRKKLVAAILEKAEAGNTAALRIVAERLGGRPGPASPATASPDEMLSREQVQARLRELLSLPELRENLERLLKGDHHAKRPTSGSDPAA